MPIYEYRCTNGHRFDVLQSFSDPPLTACEECGAPVHKVLSAPAVHFKGSGFYTTDYGRGKGARTEGSESGGGGDSSGGGDSGSSGDKVGAGSSGDSGSSSKAAGDSGSAKSSGESGSSKSSGGKGSSGTKGE